MSGRRVLGWLAPLAVIACGVPENATLAPRPSAPQDGPKASIHVSYYGGLLQRQMQVFYKTDKSAFTLVGHLGGDGVIRVLSPSGPYSRGLIGGNKMQSLQFSSYYDGAPSLFSYAVSPYRNFGALTDSYDGRGHGYIFIIASSYPLNYEEIADGDGFAIVEVEDYYQTHDPRYAINRYARLLTRGQPFTLKFATNFSTFAMTSAVDRMWDCSLLTNLGLGYSSFWNFWTPMWFYGSHRTNSYCGESNRYAFVDHRRSWYFGNPVPSPVPGPSVSIPKIPDAIKPPITRTVGRTPQRRKEETGSEVTRVADRDRSSPRTRSASRSFADPETRVRRIEATEEPSSGRQARRGRASDPYGTTPTRAPATYGGNHARPVSSSPTSSEPRASSPRETRVTRSEPTTRSEPSRSESPKSGEDKKTP